MIDFVAISRNAFTSMENIGGWNMEQLQLINVRRQRDFVALRFLVSHKFTFYLIYDNFYGFHLSLSFYSKVVTRRLFLVR